MPCFQTFCMITPLRDDKFLRFNDGEGTGQTFRNSSVRRSKPTKPYLVLLKPPIHQSGWPTKARAVSERQTEVFHWYLLSITMVANRLIKDPRCHYECHAQVSLCRIYCQTWTNVNFLKFAPNYSSLKGQFLFSSWAQFFLNKSTNMEEHCSVLPSISHERIRMNRIE